MAIFTAIATAIAGALFGGSLLAANLIGGALAFGAKLALSKLNKPKKQTFTAVQGEVQLGGDVSASALFGTGKTKGHRVFYAKWDKGNQGNTDIFALSNGWCDGLEPYVYFYGEKRTLLEQPPRGGETKHYYVEGYGSHISVRFYDGRPGQPVDMGVVTTTAALGKNWKATSRLSGICYVVVERWYSGDLFSKGRPDFEWVLRGLREYDPTKDTTVAGGNGPQRLADPSTWVHTKNPALHRLNYQLGLKGLRSGRTIVGEGKSLGQLDLASYFVAINYCRTLRKGKPIYECSLFVDGETDHTEALSAFDDAMAGYALNRRGLSGVVVGAPQIPVLTLSEDDIPADRPKPRQPRKSSFDLFNHLSGQFTSIETMWNPESLKPIVVNADVAADKRSRQTSIDFLQVSDADIAQYLLNVRYRQNRKGGTMTMPVSRRVGLEVMEGEWIEVSGKDWMISEWQCSAEFEFTLILSETGADIYDDGEIAPGPIVIPSPPVINPSMLSTVQDFNVEAGMISSAGGQDTPCLRFTWSPPEDPTITEVRIPYRKHGETIELLATCSEPESGVFLTTDGVVSETLYNARATITTVPDRLRTYTPWVTTLAPTGRMSVLDNSIIAGKIADAAVTADKLMNEAVTSIKLADQAVSTAKLQIAAVTQDILANSAVISSKLADGAVLTNKIADQAIGIGKFAAGLKPVEIVSSLPVSGNVQGRTVYLTTDNKMYRYTGSAWTAAVAATDLTGQITATQITDGGITTPKLAAGAVTTGKLAVGAVTANEIAANAITVGKVAAGAISTAEIAANAITSPKIAAGAITARELTLVDFSNMIDLGFSSGSLAGWVAAPGFVYYLEIANTPARNTWVGSSNARDQFAPNQDFAVTEGESYYFSAWVLSGDAGIYPARILLFAKDNAKNTVTFPVVASTLAGGWQFLEGIYTVPAGIAFIRPYLTVDKVAGVGSVAYWAKPNMRRAANAKLIVDGSITALEIATGAVTTDKLDANSVTAAKILAGSVTTPALAAGAVTAVNIAASTITGDKIAGNTITGDKFVANTITAKQLLLTDFSNMVTNDFSQGNLDGWTIGAGGYYDYGSAEVASDQGPFRLASTARDAGYSTLVSCSPGETYYVSAWVYNWDPYTAQLLFNTTDASGGNNVWGVANGTTLKNQWVRLQGRVTVPAGKSKCRLWLQIDKPGASGTGAFWTKPVMRRAASAELIVDGSITAAKISVNNLAAISADLGSVNISNAIIGTLTVGTSNIQAGAVISFTAFTFDAGQIGALDGSRDKSIVVNHPSSDVIIRVDGWASGTMHPTAGTQNAACAVLANGGGVASAFVQTGNSASAQPTCFGVYTPAAGTTSTTITLRGTFRAALSGGLCVVTVNKKAS